MNENKSRRDQMHPTSNIDRARRHHPFRISGGLRIGEKFETVEGMLVLSRSCGKWMRPSIYRSTSIPIPKLLRENWLSFRESDSQRLEDLASIKSDLAAVQADAVGYLLSGSVKAMDHVLAICVEDPGLWLTDFDGRVNYQGLCDPESLAEQTGISIIDSLPARDLSAGGDGRSLSPFPHWIMFADRDHRVATRSRVLVQLNHSLEMTFLPPSDGLDVELPAISFETTIGLNLIDLVLSRLKNVHQLENHDDLGKLAVQGKLIKRFFDTLCSIDSRDLNLDSVVSELIEVIMRDSLKIEDVLCSIHHFFASKIESFISGVNQRQAKKEYPYIVNEMIFAGRGGKNGLLHQLLDAKLEKVRCTTSEEFSIDLTQLKLATTCVLGLLHIDQCPTSIPSVTGAEAPRLLGRLTPGRPSNWRRLLEEMADYRPPAMKLRDAI